MQRLSSDYENFYSADFAADEQFIQWVLNPTENDLLFWENWLKAHPEKEGVVQEAKFLVLHLAQDNDGLCVNELDEIWENLKESTDQFQNSKSSKQVLGRHIKLAQVYKAAAVFLLLLLSGLVWYRLVYDVNLVYATSYGEKMTIQLPDSSTVVLNANSKLTVPKIWSVKDDRLVKLEGEAFFSVRHLQNHQLFMVELKDGVRVEVLGTEFNVSDRGGKDRVVLASGKVNVYIDTPLVISQVEMEPGQLIEVWKATGKTVKKEVNTKLYTSWKDNKFIADNTSLAEIAELLEQNYGYPVVFKDRALADLRVTASLESVSLEVLLITLSETLNLQMVQDGEKIIIKSTKQPK